MAGIDRVEDADTLAQLPAGTSESGQALALGLSDNNHTCKFYAFRFYVYAHLLGSCVLQLIS